MKKVSFTATPPREGELKIILILISPLYLLCPAIRWPKIEDNQLLFLLRRPLIKSG
jgi:hypothetical protein